MKLWRGILILVVLTLVFSFANFASSAYLYPDVSIEEYSTPAIYLDLVWNTDKWIQDPSNPDAGLVYNESGIAESDALCLNRNENFIADEDNTTGYFGSYYWNGGEDEVTWQYPYDGYTRAVRHPISMLHQSCSYNDYEDRRHYYTTIGGIGYITNYFYSTQLSAPLVDIKLDGQSPTCSVNQTRTDPVYGNATGCWQNGISADTLIKTAPNANACTGSGGTFYTNHYGIIGTQEVPYTTQEKCNLQTTVGATHAVSWEGYCGVNTSDTWTNNSWPLGTAPAPNMTNCRSTWAPSIANPTGTPTPHSGSPVTGSQNIVFSQAGTFKFQATMSNADGGSTDYETVEVGVGDVVCAPESQSAVTGSTVNFTATGGDGVNYTWSAPGGGANLPNGANFSTSYNSSGNKVVTVTSAGRSDTCGVSLSAANLSVGLVANPPNGITPLTSELTATVTSNLSGTTNYKIWYNCPSYNSSTHANYTYSQMKTLCSGGNDAPHTSNSSESVTDKVSNQYVGANTYRAVVLVEKNSMVASNYTDIVVYPTLTCSPTTQNADINQNATVTATGGSGTYAWTGGGTPPSAPSGTTFTTKYSSGGNKTVRLDSGGGYTTCTVAVNGEPTVTITPQPPCGANCGGGPMNYCSGLTANIAWHYSDPENDPQSAFQVQLDDQGSFADPEFDSCQGGITTGTCTGSTLTNYNVTPQLFNTTYRARVRVWDNKGNVSAWVTTNSWTTPAHAYPAVAFEAVQAVGSKNVQFTDKTQYYDTGGSARSWQWDFDNNGSVESTVQSPLYSYASYTTYTAKFTATDKQGYSCSATGSVDLKKATPNWKEIVPKF